MQNAAWYLNRLRSMNAAEIAWRVRSLISANLDLVRIPLKLYPKLKVRGKLALSGFEPGYACSPASVEFADRRGEEPFLHWERRLLASADTIMANRISFFDLSDQFLGDPVDWHRDHAAGKGAPQRLSNLLDYRDFDSAGDCKLVWEPNRHHQFVVLARAWCATGDKRYARKVVELMCHWIDSNPFGYGMNWKSPLELGVRLINWVWAIDLIRDAGVFSDAEWQSVLRSIYLAMWDTHRKFSRGSSANNHLIGEVAGVYVASCYFSEMPNAADWRTESRKILEREIELQSFPDGCSREHAFGYQFFVLQFFTVSLLAGQRTGDAFSDGFRKRLHAQYRFMADICADTGVQPNFGDADDGYVLDLGERPDQTAALIAVGGHLFDDPDIVRVDNSESAFWLLGVVKPDLAHGEAVRSSTAYRESGYYVLRSGQESGALPVRLFFDCAELGFGAIAAHGHADCLSFSLAVAGREMLVDPGTYDYFSYPEWRHYFRTTRAHNTVTVDGQDQSESLGPFIWGSRAEARLIDWQEDAEHVLVSGEHDGYLRLADPVVHRRTVTIDKSTGTVDIRDLLSANGSHEIQLNFHVAPDCTVDWLSGGNVAIGNGSATLEMSSDSGNLQILKADGDRHRGWVSDGYHRRRPGHCIVLETTIDGPSEIGTTIRTG